MTCLSMDRITDGQDMEMTVDPHWSCTHYRSKEGDFAFDGVKKRSLIAVVVCGGHAGIF